jgi:hypothetical protein
MIALLLLACQQPTEAPAVVNVAPAAVHVWEFPCEPDGTASLEDPELAAALAISPPVADQCGCPSPGDCYCTGQNLNVYAYDWGVDARCLVGYTVRIRG